MQVFFIHPNGKKTARISLRGPLIIGCMLGLVSAFYGGLRLGPVISNPTDVDDPGTDHLRAELQSQQQKLGGLQKETQERLDTLALHLGQLQAQMIRLNVVGQRIAKKADIDDNEFNFEELPPMGGLESDVDVQTQDFEKLIDDMREFSVQLQQKELQMNALDAFYTNRALDKEFIPEGNPIKNGWLSSYYGWRTDPFTGRKTFHDGVDFAGKKGSEVVAVASGVVSFSGTKNGYGKLVEISHGDGYVTRYAHHKKILVRLGETVRKDQVIALMGSTGRSTGPHVHFEVLLNRKKVNPIQYLKTVTKGRS